MKKYIILVAFLGISIIHNAQNLQPKSVFFSYFGETITHPGLKIGVTYELKNWQSHKIKKNGVEKTVEKSFNLSPTVGFFYHKDYQSGFFFIPEISYKKTKRSGNSVIYGLGAGYMRTLIPRAYELNSNDEIVKINPGHNYFITNYFVALAKDLSVKSKIPLELFVKPQLMYALPNYSGGVLYFAMELGFQYKLTKSMNSKKTLR